VPHLQHHSTSPLITHFYRSMIFTVFGLLPSRPRMNLIHSGRAAVFLHHFLLPIATATAQRHFSEIRLSSSILYSENLMTFSPLGPLRHHLPSCPSVLLILLNSQDLEACPVLSIPLGLCLAFYLLSSHPRLRVPTLGRLELNKIEVTKRALRAM